MSPIRGGILRLGLLSTIGMCACSRVSTPLPLQPPSPTESVAAGDAVLRPVHLSEEEIMPAAIGLVSAVNVLRNQQDLPPLTASGTLMALAGIRAEGMADGRYLGHEDPAGNSPTAQELLGNTGFRGPVAELVYGNQGSLEGLPALAVEAWEASPVNRELILSRDYAFAGVGIQGDGTWWKVALLLAASEP